MSIALGGKTYSAVQAEDGGRISGAIEPDDAIWRKIEETSGCRGIRKMATTNGRQLKCSDSHDLLAD